MKKRDLTLYHFTDGGFPMDDGLKAHCTEFNSPMQGSNALVWFTTEANPVWWWEDGKKSKFRITVEIPSADKRLVRFGDWMKKNFTPKQIKMMKNDPLTPKGLWAAEMKSWYMYFGDVPLSKIRAVEYADPKEKAPLTKLASPQGVKTAAEGF